MQKNQLQCFIIGLKSFVDMSESMTLSQISFFMLSHNGWRIFDRHRRRLASLLQIDKISDLRASLAQASKRYLYNDMGNDNCDSISPCTKLVANVWPVAIAINPVFLWSECKDLLQFRGFATHLFRKTGGIERLSALFLWHHEKKRERS